MTAAEILTLQRARWRRPSSWAVLAGWTLLSAVAPVVQQGLHFGLLGWLFWIVCQLLTYWSFAWIGPWPWLWKRTGSHLATGFLASLAFGSLSFLAVTLPETLRHVLQGRAAFSTQFRGEVAENALFYVATFLLVGGGIAALEREGRARSVAERREKEAQWVLLRGQLSPHVLFNGMTGLARLVRKDPEKAERAAEDLAELFRRLMDHAHRHLSPLVEERELVERYLRLEALRLGERLQVTWAWDPALDAVEAPPFLLQPLVENALKHGIAPAPEGGRLHLVGRLEGGRVVLEVANTGRPCEGRGGGGLGLRNLEARLALAFQEEGTFTLGREGDHTVARLAFPKLEELA